LPRRAIVIAPLLAVLATGLAGHAASAQRPPPPGTLQSIASGKCADLPSGETGEGTELIQFDCHGGRNQQWTIESLGAVGWRILSVMSGKCLDTKARRSGGGAYVVEVSCDGSLSQLWSIRNDGNGYVLQNVASRLCLDVLGGSSASGTKLIAWRCTGERNQTWRYGSDLPP
jgi:hypothetical protein